jgi:preprotein translocase subunit SecA
MRCSIPIAEPEQVKQAPAETQVKQRQQLQETKQDLNDDSQRTAANHDTRERQPVQPVRNEGPKIGRNDLCPCGSGKKFKNCHGRGIC